MIKLICGLVAVILAYGLGWALGKIVTKFKK